MFGEFDNLWGVRRTSQRIARISSGVIPERLRHSATAISDQSLSRRFHAFVPNDWPTLGNNLGSSEFRRSHEVYQGVVGDSGEWHEVRREGRSVISPGIGAQGSDVEEIRCRKRATS